jgi:hypothetical protein
LMPRLNLVGSMTGRSAGLAPLKISPTATDRFLNDNGRSA